MGYSFKTKGDIERWGFLALSLLEHQNAVQNGGFLLLNYERLQARQYSSFFLNRSLVPGVCSPAIRMHSNESSLANTPYTMAQTRFPAFPLADLSLTLGNIKIYLNVTSQHFYFVLNLLFVVLLGDGQQISRSICETSLAAVKQ